jgi:predicted dehydrogenase
VDACRAGKDVYLEKPLANSTDGCLEIVRSVREHKRVFQLGVQQRSMSVFQEAREQLRSGLIGKVHDIECCWRGVLPEVAEQPVQPVAAGLDWEMFQGPAPRRPYTPTRQSEWRTYWDYGSGTFTDLGVHLLDVVLWFMDTRTPPRLAMSAGGIFSRKPDGRAPDTLEATWRYDGFVVTFSNRPRDWGVYFWGEKGVLHVNRTKYALSAHPAVRKPAFAPIEKRSFPDGRGGAGVNSAAFLHIQNFLDCVRSRAKTAADPESAWMATLPALLAARSYRDGKAYGWDGQPRPA